jgi:uncharacterized membrane protein YfcA
MPEPAILGPLAALVGAGLVAGFAAGLFGIGGGFVVVPALLLVLPLLGGSEANLVHVAIATSLATIVPTSIRSVRAHAARGAVDFAILRSWAPWIMVGAALGSILASFLSGGILMIVFGVGVILMSLHFLTRITANAQLRQNMPEGWLRAGISSVLGLFSALLGIGGGTIAIIVMTLCGRSIHVAIATASGLGALIAIPGVIGFALAGLHAEGLPMTSLGFVNIPAALAIAAMSVFTAPLGASIAHKLPAGTLKPIFGVYLLIVGAVMIRRGLST